MIVLVGPTLYSVLDQRAAEAIGWKRATSTYTRNFRTSIVAVGSAGKKALDSAMRAATKKVTVVKKPKTFWTRTNEECIFLFIFVRRVVVGYYSRYLLRSGLWGEVTG